jgi:hypothetical protein
MSLSMDSALTGNTFSLKLCQLPKNWQRTAPKLKPMFQAEEFFFPKKGKEFFENIGNL